MIAILFIIIYVLLGIITTLSCRIKIGPADQVFMYVACTIFWPLVTLTLLGDWFFEKR